MKKIIKITKEPSFNPGVISYVSQLNVNSGLHATSPNLKIAKLFNNNSAELTEALSITKERFKDATVETIKFNILK